MINCIAIDDEPLALEVIKLHCKKIASIHLEKTFLSAPEAINYLNTVAIDLVFLDINMPEINGLKFRTLIPQHIQIIFITAYHEHALESYNSNATDYILKPVSFDRFYKAVQKCENSAINNTAKELESPKEKTILVKGNKKVFQVTITDIEYIEGLKDYARIRLNSGEKIVIRESLKRISNRLENYGFMRVHRSFIIPIDKISSIYGNTINIGEAEIPLSKSQREVILERFKKRGILGDRSI
ncbi:MAG: DNA-binding LytR/AlgR family response regulator [Crocinitomix sp.]|jgi:DNA-binding LytR/AlgR family response regulator